MSMNNTDIDALAVSQTPIENFYRTHSPDTL